MERTQSHVIAVLTHAGYSGITERWLIFLRQKKLLPPLQQRGKGRGSGAYYCWTEPEIIKRMAIIYQLLPMGCHVSSAYLPLWLLGYDVPLDIIRAQLLKWAEGDMFRLTQGKVDPDEIDDLLGDWIDRDAAKSHRSRRETPPVSFGVVQEVIQPALNVLANRRYKLNKTAVKKLLKRAQELNGQKEASSTGYSAMWRQPEMIDWILKAASFVQEHLSVHALHNAIATATDDELRQAQSDFSTIVEFLRLAPLDKMEDNAIWAEYPFRLLAALGCLTVAGSLALRHGGHGTYVDQAVQWVEDTLKDIKSENNVACIEPKWGIR